MKMTKKQKSKSEWKTIGYVGVDSGSLIIGDPCYLEGDDWNESQYDKWIVGNLCEHDSVQIDDKCSAQAVAFTSGLGDGVYRVEAKFVNYGDWGRRIKEVKIILIEDEN